MPRVTSVHPSTLDHLLRRQVRRTGETRHPLDVRDATGIGVVQGDAPVPRSVRTVRAAHSQNPIRISEVASAFSTVSWTAK
jgi:hypothetical protein